MQIAYLINQYPQPSQTFIRREIQALESQGFQIARFSIRRWPGQLVDPADQEEAARTRVVLESGVLRLAWAMIGTLLRHPLRFCQTVVRAWRLGRRSDRGLLMHWIYLAEACLLRQWLSAAGVQHVHVHFGTNGPLVALLCRRLGGPTYSFTVHGPEEFDRPLQLRLGEKVAESAFSVAISQFGRSQLLRWSAPADWPRIHVVRCGLDPSFLSAPRTVPTEARQLVCVARLDQQKGLPILLEAAAQLQREGVSFRLVVLGEGPLRGRLEAQIADQGLSSCVQLAGWASNAQVRAALEASRALVLSSFAEGLPVVLMEALAMHRPVICTRIAGVPELVEHGVQGWVVSAGSAEELAAAMREALEAPCAQLARMGDAGTARVAQLHDAEREGERLGALIRASLTR